MQDLRPIRSPSQPNSGAPNMMPNRLALNTGAKAARCRCQALSRLGAAKLITCTS